MDFIFRVHNDKCKGVDSFENDLYTGMCMYSSKFLTEARNKGAEMNTFFLIYWPVSELMMGVSGFLSDPLIIQSG